MERDATPVELRQSFLDIPDRKRRGRVSPFSFRFYKRFDNNKHLSPRGGYAVNGLLGWNCAAMGLTESLADRSGGMPSWSCENESHYNGRKAALSV